MSKFEVGEVVIYQNGDRFELGIVKSVRSFAPTFYLGEQPVAVSPPATYSYFVNYHTGDTAALTDERDLHKVSNIYAFEIRRKTPEE